MWAKLDKRLCSFLSFASDVYFWVIGQIHKATALAFGLHQLSNIWPSVVQMAASLSEHSLHMDSSGAALVGLLSPACHERNTLCGYDVKVGNITAVMYCCAPF